jgi:hypothetical protein
MKKSDLNILRKWKISLVLFPIAIYFLVHRGEYTLIDNADLVIHEAGHFFFMFFGQFIQMAGGTLMQIIFPLFLAWYFYSNGYTTGVQIFVFWLGQNLINISVYAADAPTRKLPLVGGGKHDWYYLLSKLGILEFADAVGILFVVFAVLAFLLSMAIPRFTE